MDAYIPLYLQVELGMALEDVPRWTGILAGAPLLIAAPLSPFWGVLADRYNHKIIILRSLFVASIGYGIAALTQDVWQLLSVRLLLGLTFGSNAVIIALLSSVVPSRRLGLAIGLMMATLPIGKSIGPLVGSGLISLVGLRGMFAADALFTFGAFLMVLLLFQEPPRKRDVSLGILKRLSTVLRLVWKLPPLRLNFLLFSLFAGGMWLLTPFLPVLIQHVHEGEDLAFVIGLTLAGYGAAAAVAAPVAGRLADWAGPTRLVTLNMAGLLLMSGGLIFAATPLQVALVVLLGGIPFGASNTALYAHLARHSPREHLGAIMSLTPFARNTAMLIGPMLGAAVAGFGLSAVFATGVVIYGVALGLSLAMERASGKLGDE